MNLSCTASLSFSFSLLLLFPAIAATERSLTSDPDIVYPPKVGIFDVRHYGAAGDGSTDDTQAIRRAMADAFTHGGSVVYFPSGTYLISDTLWWATDGNPPARATAHIDTKKSCITDISIQNGGHGYVNPFGGGPGVILSGGGGWGAAAYARLAGDSVVAIEFAGGKSCYGSHYSSAPSVRVVNFHAWLGFQGQNRATTRIKLKDHAAGFGDSGCIAMYNSESPGEYCKAMLFVASAGASNPIGGGESAYYTDVFDMTIDAGTGNPGAIGIDWAASNTAAIRNVTVTGAGRVGLNTSKGWSGGGNGPALVTNFAVNGFDYGIISGSGEVGLTFEHIVLNRQKTAGFWNQNQNVWIRDLRSTNTVPAVINQDNGNMALVDATFLGGLSDQSAILNQGNSTPGHLYARNISTAGYSSAIRQGQGTGDKAGKIVTGASVNEYESDGVISLRSSSGRSLNLPVRETPRPFVDNNFKDWAIVTAYGANPNDAADDTGSIQAALNSGKPVVFLPAGSYRISGTLYIPHTVRKIFGLGSQLTTLNGGRASYPALECDAATGGPIEIRSLTFDISTLGNPSILNNCEVPLVLADVFDVNGYENRPGKGLEVYFENAAIPGGVVQHGGNVWARQLDIENNSTHLLNDGANVWILGYKTEGTDDGGVGMFYTKNGGRSEVIGAFNSTPIGDLYHAPAYTSVNSPLSIAALSAGLFMGTVIRDIDGGRVSTYRNNGKRYGGTAISLYTNTVQ